jgi:Tfp pilus assembly protein PilF
VGCQTTTPDGRTSQENGAVNKTDVLDSQKALVRNAIDTGKPEQAMQSLRTMLRSRPDDASLHNLMGLAQLATKNTDRAIASFRKSYSLEPTPATALNLSSAYIEGGDYDRAIRLLKRLLEPQKGKEEYHYKERLYHNLGYAYVKQKNVAKAKAYFQEALAENPAFFPSHLELARIYESTNKPAQAIRTYRASIDYCAICYEPVQALTALYLKTGQRSDAQKALMRFTKTDGISAHDKDAAMRLLRQVTTAGLNTRRAG